MNQKMKAKAGIIISALGMMFFLAPAAVLAGIMAAFPDTDATLIQMIVTLPSLLSIPMGIVTAKLAQKIYKKHLILAATAIYFVSGILPFFFHTNIYGILCCSCAAGVGMGMGMTALTSLLCDFFTGAERGAMLGLYAAAISAGGTISSLLGGRLGADGWERAFLAYLFLMPILVLDLIFLPMGNLDKAEESSGKKEGSVRSLSPMVWLIALTGFVFYAAVNAFNNNASMLVVERVLGDSVQASYITTAYTVSGMVTGFLVGKILEKIHRKTIGTAYVLGAAGLAIGFFGTSIPLICIGAALAGAGFCMFTSTANFHVSELAKPGTLTFSLAFLSAIINLGQAFSPVIVNSCAKIAGSTVGVRFIVMAAACLVIAVIALLTLKNDASK